MSTPDPEGWTEPKFMDFEQPKAPKGKKKRKKKRPGTDIKGIPLAPARTQPLTGDEVRRGVTERYRSAANLKVEGYSYDEIADLLEFESPTEARRAVEAVISALHSPDEYETLRLVVIARTEEQFKRSSAFARASELRTSEGEIIPNADQLRWHQQAGVDLMNLATITGTKAPIKVDITPGEIDLERIAQALLSRTGHEDIVDADVLDFEDLPALTMGEDDDDDTIQG